MKTIRQLFESFRFAWNALKVNVLRTILSLLGVTIGIFAIIAVLTIVDSLENSIKNSFSFLGSNNINVEKWPYGFDGEYPWWKYFKRPQPTFEEFEFLQEKLTTYKAMSIYVIRGNAVMKYGNNSSNENYFFGVSYDHDKVFDIEIEKGRYFTEQEVASARNVALIGVDIVKDLFPGETEFIGKEVKIRGIKFSVIGVMKREGESFLGTPSNDMICMVPYHSFLKLYYSSSTGGIGSSITIKGLDEDEHLEDLEGELRGLMRRKRGLKPTEDDDFALNRPEAIANQIGSLFKVIKVAGWVIGGFSMLVGGFGIANIMFVSVKERTHIIGIQKSLGAKNYFILFQFLFEAVFLSVIGGGVGIFLVYLISFIPLGTLEVILSFDNIVLGVGVSAIIGIIAGIVPAAVASSLDPVIAIRTK